MDFYLEPFEFPSKKEETRAAFESYVRSFESSFSRWGPLELDRDPEELKRDVFLSVAGEDFLENLEEILSYPEMSSYDMICTSFLSKHSTIAFLLQDTLLFRRLSQGENESLSEFASRVRLKASLLPSECVADLEHSIWVQVLLGMQHTELAQEALLGHWTLEDILAHDEPLDREVVCSLIETETRVFKSENGSYYDQRALEKRHSQMEGGRSKRASSQEALSLGDAFEEIDVVPKKKMRMEEAVRIKGLIIAPQDNGEKDEALKERRQNELAQIYNVLRGGERRASPPSQSGSEGEKLKCSGCAECFEDKRKLVRHREKTCKWCSICFQTKSDLSVHNVEAHNNTSAQCSLCKRVFTSKAGLELHMQTMHDRQDTYRCHYCGSGYPLEKMLSTHIRRVHLKERKFNCDRCGKRFETNGLLTKHINGVHENKITAICHICSKPFTQVSCYRAHVLRVHENIRNFKCDICEARFHASTDLLKHKKGVHDKILDFVCEFCKKGFSRNSILQKHIKAIHSNDREYQCHLCSNAYVSKYNLHRHIQEAHERVKQRCNICQKDIAGFGGGNLAKHMKKAHGVISSSVSPRNNVLSP